MKALSLTISHCSIIPLFQSSILPRQDPQQHRRKLLFSAPANSAAGLLHSRFAHLAPHHLIGISDSFAFIRFATTKVADIGGSQA